MRSGSACGRTSVFSHLPLGLVHDANPLGHLHQHRHQLGLQLQLLPQRPATAMPQCCLHLAQPAAVVWVVVCLLQQPTSVQSTTQIQRNTMTHKTLNNHRSCRLLIVFSSSVCLSSSSSSSSACSSPVELLGDLNILQRPLQQQRHQRPVQVPFILQGLQGRKADQTVTHKPPCCTGLHCVALVSKQRNKKRLPGPTVAETSPAPRLESA